jgi:hypothetical protein
VVVVLVVAGVALAGAGCGDRAAAIDARIDPVVCKADLEASIDRACTVPSDCVLVDSQDCCGTIVLAVRAGTEASFATAEASYGACLACGPRGCQHADEAEDGTAPGAGQAIVADCVAMRCQSAVQ